MYLLEHILKAGDQIAQAFHSLVVNGICGNQVGVDRVLGAGDKCELCFASHSPSS